jgi:hypothetical protein
LISYQPAGWYLIDFAHSRHTNPARIPVVVTADRYQSCAAPINRDVGTEAAARSCAPEKKSRPLRRLS